MTDKEYINGIATLIVNYRRAELTKPLDVAHVKKWVEQFETDERSVVLRETFYALSRYYIKEERIHAFLERVLGQITENRNINDIVFVSVQEKGYSQLLIYKYIETKGAFIFQSKKFIDASKLYVYIDDGLYSGRRTRDDIRKLISLLPQGAHLQVYYMVAFSNGFEYWSNRLSEEAAEKEVYVEFFCEIKYINDRTKKLANYEFLWPDISCRNEKSVVNFEKKLMQTGKMYYLYCYNKDNAGVSSSAETNKQLTAIFLKYGIRIVNQVKSSKFLPLGFGYPLSFGFGAFCANDWNIPNNSPLVLWWGDIDDPGTMVGSWYPLLPRRDNKKLYQEICQFEKDLSLAGNANVLKTVYRLSEDEYRTNIEANQGWGDMLKHIDIYAPARMRKMSNLYQYMKGLDMDVIKIIQTVMYIGRDYSYEKDIERYYASCENAESSEVKNISLKVDDPELLLAVWMEDLTWVKGWKGKSIEIEQIYSKILRLPEYLKRAFEILGIQ